MPLPEGETRLQLILHLMQKQEQASGGGNKSRLSQKSLAMIVKQTEGYSASDITAVSTDILVFC